MPGGPAHCSASWSGSRNIIRTNTCRRRSGDVAKTDVPLSQLYSVVTFFALLNLEPQGDHTICICRGTACHTRGSRSLLQRLRLELGLPEESEERRR